MRALITLLKTELKLTVRGMDTLIFGVVFPCIVAIILGIVVGSRPAFEGADYTFMQQSFGAIAAIGICATGLMGLPLTVADYRHKKILKRFRVTPVSPALMLGIQFIVNLIMSVASFVLVLAVCMLFFGYRMTGSFVGFAMSYLLVLLSIYSMGLMLASISPNIKTANLLCCLIYFPMLIFSGATLPYEVMPKGLQRAANILPLTQGIKLLKGTSLGTPLENILMPVVIIVALAIISIGVAVKTFRWE